MDAEARAALGAAVARLAGGDRSAQVPIFRAVWPVLCEFCRRMLRDTADAEDAAQRALVRVFEQAIDYDLERDALTWAVQLALWECRSQLRRRTRAREKELDAEALRVIDARPPPDAVAERLELDLALVAALASLPDADRRALVEAVQENVAPATWRKRRERALSRLRIVWRSVHGS